ncbi:hydroxypyruvate isomerase family protein [Stratiformator vulcanicus]|uniref:Hydroxypyruvate isomerase n=1 Tax=Stratiformator vulcanicus TaxID=2527980 RepID=A0A517QYE9_9PLAN|nr:TIM barrel protein [Stratiformator vulcanicus]QDT36623.1 Hydroxypyruvate isomerase [Stratiformator vulcanicus]
MDHVVQASGFDDGSVSRRRLLAGAAAGAAFLATGRPASTADDASPAKSSAAGGRLKQSVSRWCFGRIPLDRFCKEVNRLGLVGIDLLGPESFPTLKKHGLVCTMTTSHRLANGLCDPKFHDDCITKITAAIEANAAEQFKNVACFSGNARGIDPKTGMANCVRALKEVTPLAEEKNVTLCMELLNSKVDHADYMCDNSKWGVELVKQVGSDNFKLLYDIYHMQIMEGDVIRTIRANHEYFGHYHTAGNPGRNELDDSQELNYTPIAKAVADTGFDGYFAHEFVPTRDPLTSLAEAVEVCRV